MENKLNYLEKLIKVILWPIIFIVGHFFIEYIFVAYYNSNNKGNLTNKEFLEYVKTCEYKELLNKFIDSKLVLITLILFIVFVPILYFVYKKYKSGTYKCGYFLESILFGATIALIFNITLYNINKVIHFTDRFDKLGLPFMTVLICTGIIGPILEELLFRGVVYNKLKTFNKPMTAIILTSVLFGLFHFDLINSIYAFGVSFMFIYLYEKYNTLIAPILMHITLNLIPIILIKLGILSITIINILLILVSILIVMRKIIINNE